MRGKYVDEDSRLVQVFLSQTQSRIRYQVWKNRGLLIRV